MSEESLTTTVVPQKQRPTWYDVSLQKKSPIQANTSAKDII